ncbi:Glycoside hydrolase [Trema orientale]|uniref:Glycoside hydrolase n=1 Tax=Trema orientale TaxID=63057 RepID=A0A2P5C3Y9_TREOI|nr:Glycoside hydrolase [Trema orientale]
MGVFGIVLILGLVSATISCSNAYKNPESINVLDYGAVSDGITDDSEAFLKAWNEACNSTGSENPTLVIPNQNFLLKPVVFSGPCQANNISLQAASLHQPHLKRGPTAGFRGHNRAQHRRSWSDRWSGSQAHVSIRNCDGINISNLTIEAPGNSPNTDGIHIHASQNLIIDNIYIGTGDDCIFIENHTSNIQISQVRCGPGHGISIGNLGKGGSFVLVENIYVSRVYLNGTSNGARIKTWQVGKGYVRGVIFEQFYLDSVKNPIIIDQNYCNIRGGCKEQHTGVKISNVAFSDFKGTSSSDVAINLNCSRAVACTGILLTTIQLKSAKLEHNVTSSCTSAHGYSLGVVEPGSCLQN